MSVDITVDGEFPVRRLFVPISTTGCGSGCTYCFISAPRGVPEYLPVHAVRDSIEAIISSPRFVPGNRGDMITLCPETEPFKSPESTRLVMAAVEVLAPYGNRLQLATKERIPSEFSDLATSIPALSTFTSFSTISKAREIEPGAAHPATRAKNLTDPAGGIALLKPFLPITERDSALFVSLFRENRPRQIVIGMAYRRTRSQAEPEFPHPVYPGWVAPGVPPGIERMSRLFEEELGVLAFRNSTCVQAFQLDVDPPTPVWKEPDLCVRCRGCPQP